MALSVLIVDDEPLARERLGQLLRSAREVTIAGECDNGAAALEAIASLDPDVVILDVEMPGMSGIDVARRIDPANAPIVIFATAYGEFAVQAFEVRAADYLVKPMDPDRLHTALERARDLKAAKRDTALAPDVLDQLSRIPTPERRHQERFLVRKGHRLLAINTETIEWVESAANYVRLHVGAEEYLLRASLRDMADKLDPRKFVRIHRQCIVNVDCVRSLEPWGRGEYVITMRSGREITSSRSYREELFRGLGVAEPDEPAP